MRTFSELQEMVRLNGDHDMEPSQALKNFRRLRSDLSKNDSDLTDEQKEILRAGLLESYDKATEHFARHCREG